MPPDISRGSRDRARARSAAPQSQLRRAPGRARHQSHPGAWRPAGADRAERRRQDHARQSDQRRARSLFRPGAALRRGHHEALAGRAGAAGHRPDFQINQLFRGLPVLENICLVIGERSGECNNLWRPAGSRRAVIDEALDHLDSLRLAEDALKLVRELPYGRQRLVEIAIALAQKPRVLLLDEPAAGVPSSESHLILDVVDQLDPDIAVLIIEHDMDVVYRFAKQITVMVQ